MQDKLCGVYCIENTVNNRKYIGISRDIKRRWLEHKSELDNHSHNNQYLQASWDKYGKEKFNFYIIELCAEALLSEREQFYKAIDLCLMRMAITSLLVGKICPLEKPLYRLKMV